MKDKMTAIRWLKYWFKGTYDQLLQLLGIRLSDFWLLIRSIHRDHGGEEAKALWAAAICLGLKHGTRNNKKTREKIIEATETGIVGIKEVKQDLLAMAKRIERLGPSTIALPNEPVDFWVHTKNDGSFSRVDFASVVRHIANSEVE